MDKRKNKNLFELLSELTSDIPEKRKKAILASEKFRFSISSAMIKLRKKMGLTQKELAERLGVSQSWVSKLENANNDHQIESILRYLKALGADMTLVVTYEAGDQTIVVRVSENDVSFESQPGHFAYRHRIRPVFSRNTRSGRIPMGA